MSEDVYVNVWYLSLPVCHRVWKCFYLRTCVSRYTSTSLATRVCEGNVSIYVASIFSYRGLSQREGEKGVGGWGFSAPSVIPGGSSCTDVCCVEFITVTVKIVPIFGFETLLIPSGPLSLGFTSHSPTRFWVTYG